MRKHTKTAVTAVLLALGLAWSCGAARKAPDGSMTLGSGTARSGFAVKQVPGARLQFAVIGDYGVNSQEEAQVARMVVDANPAFVLTTGDNNYPLGMGATIDANIGRHYASLMGTSLKDNRFWPSAGNHDWYAPTGIQPYTDYFVLPGNERYYDVDFGLVQVFAVDSDAHEPDGILPNSKQAAWLKGALAASRACFKIVYFHHPPYTSSEHRSTLAMRWPFKEWGVDVVLSGHDHTYERLEANGLTYIVNGLGGAPIYDFKDPMAESVFRYNAHHGAQFGVATMEGMSLEFRNVLGEVVDTFTVKRACGGAPKAVEPVKVEPAAEAPKAVEPAKVPAPVDAGTLAK